MRKDRHVSWFNAGAVVAALVAIGLCAAHGVHVLVGLLVSVLTFILT